MALKLVFQDGETKSVVYPQAYMSAKEFYLVYQGRQYELDTCEITNVTDIELTLCPRRALRPRQPGTANLQPAILKVLLEYYPSPVLRKTILSIVDSGIPKDVKTHYDRVHVALHNLKKRGLITNSPLGWQLTDSTM